MRFSFIDFSFYIFCMTLTGFCSSELNCLNIFIEFVNMFDINLYSLFTSYVNYIRRSDSYGIDYIHGRSKFTSALQK